MTRKQRKLLRNLQIQEQIQKSKQKTKSEWESGWEERNQDIIQKMERTSWWIEHLWDKMFQGRDERGYAISRRQDEDIDQDIKDEHLSQTWGLPPSSPTSAPWED